MSKLPIIIPKKKFPSIPWKEPIGLRNRLIHAYFDVGHDIVWKTIREYFPPFQELQQKAVDTIPVQNKAHSLSHILTTL
jgi:uncharacterized protein with HEPN domain